MVYITLVVNALLCATSFAYGFNEGPGEEYLYFPDGFWIGSSTSSYQIEGAWNISDKDEGVWDRKTHTRPDLFTDGSNGDVACDSYHKYKEDVQILKKIGTDFYRFSLSWPRILPTGYANVTSKDGLRYYNNLIDELLKNNITPMVTIYHWDHPQVFEDFGGWTNERIIELFASYARLVFKEFGDRVKIFSTVNEASQVCRRYEEKDGIFNPAFYQCSHNILKAHARAYHIYDKEFRSQQNGKCGIVIDSPYYFSKYEHDEESADIAFQFSYGLYAHPIFSKRGDWPDVVKERVAANSQFEGLPNSKLPSFSKEWINYIKGTADYLGVNHYTSHLAEPAPKSNDSLYPHDHGLIYTDDEKWPSSVTGWLRIVPEGFMRLLLKIKEEYDNPSMYITENGIPDGGTVDDDERIVYLHSYMKAMLIAINKYGCNIHGYGIWSLLDNFEWFKGYTEKFGLVNVDFNHPNRTRTLKKSAFWIKDVIRTRSLLPIK